MGKRALILVRVSSDGQKDNYSPESQEASCRHYARDLGLDVVRVLSEVCSGAYEFDERPVFGEVLDAIRNRQVDAVVIHRMNRATRAGGIHALMLANECERNKVDLHFVDGQVKGLVDVTSTAGRVMLLIAGDQAHEERISLIEAMARGRRTRATTHGRPLAGRRVKYGYYWIDEQEPSGKIIPKARAAILEPEAVVVRRIYREASQGVPIRAIAQHLMADGVPNTLGEPKWSQGVIREILKDTRYMGVAYAYSKKKVRVEGAGKKYKQLSVPEAERVLLPPGTFPAIVDPDLWEIVQARLADSQAKATRNNPYPERALLRGGYVVCAECDNNLFVKNLPDGKAKYWCTKTEWNRDKCHHPTIATGLLDTAVWSLLTHLLKYPEVLQRELDKQSASGQGLQADLEAYERELAPIVAREKMLIGMMSTAADDFQRQEMQAQLTQAAKQRQAAQQAVNQAKRRLDNEQRQTQDLLDTTRMLPLLAQRIDNTSHDEKRIIVRALVQKIWLWPASESTRWKIALCIPRYVSEQIVSGEELAHIVNSTTPR